ncbi:MAG: GTPase, partial [Planctomycetes bacterium]|nr:GTPase [Planctomycetota bacterium]
SGQGKLHYWLDSIEALAPDSPVLLVATHLDERDADLPLAELRARYPQIVGQCEISNKTGQGIDNLREVLTETAAALPLMGETWPATWLDAAEAVRAREEKHVTPAVFREIMAAHGVSGGNADVLTRWMHELGDVLYFQDDKELDDLVILKPQWVTQYISKVLESKEVNDRHGVFTREQMDGLWRDLDPGMRDHFLRLMERFDLSYRILENREISLVVERLPLDSPDYERKWETPRQTEPCREISMRFRLNTIPAGIPTWFIARTHRFTTHTHWRSGAVFADGREEKHLALAKALKHDRYVELCVRGPSPHNFFALLKDGMELTLSRFPGLKIDRMIPCPGHDGGPCDHEFRYADLERAIERNPPKLEIECPVSFEPVSVPGLLFGLHWRVQDEVLKEIHRLEATFTEGHDEILAELHDLRQLAQREFLNIYRREQSKIDSECPNVFVLLPVETSGWKKALVGQKVELQLYCQAPGHWHPTETGGQYAIDDPAPWIRATAPYVRKLVSVLKYAAPLAGPTLGVAAPTYAKAVKDHVALMTELIKKLPELEKGRDLQLAETVGGHDDPQRIGGAALRAVRELLDAKDPKHDWGGLEKVLTPEGHYLWLCKHHAEEYAK